MEDNPIVEIKIIRIGYDSLAGIRKTSAGVFHDHHERYPYIGSYIEGEIVNARLIYQAKYPTNQWRSMPDWMVEGTDRETRRVYVDSI